MRAIIFGLPTLGILTALAAAGITEVEFNTSGPEALAQDGEKPEAAPGDPVTLRRETVTEAISALTGAKAVLGDVANISHAIGLLEGAISPEAVTSTSAAASFTGQGALATRGLPPFLGMLLGALLSDPAPCGDPTCEACAAPEAADKAAAADPFGGEVPEVASKDARFDPLEAAQNMLEQVADGEVVAVSLVGITSTGAVTLISSESTGQTLNMLAQGIKVADGTLAPSDPSDD